jgi:ferredoxin
MMCRVEFPGTSFAAIDLPANHFLSEWLSAANSPALFGCRTGICGTCLVEIEAIGPSDMAQPIAREAEALEIYAPGNRLARLACQVRLTTHIRLRKIGSL